MDPLLYWKNFKPMDEFLYNWLETTCILLGAIGFMLNIIVIHFLLSTKRKFKVTSNRYLLINLALSDILRLVSSVPLKLISSIYKQWIFGDLGCQIYGFIGGFAGFLSTSTLAIMAIERYFMIKNPLIAFKNRKKLIIIIIISSWIYSLFCASIQLFSKRGFVLEGMLTSCTFDYLSGDLNSRLIICSIVLGGFIIPFVLLVSFYTLALKTLKAKVEYFKSVSNIETLINSTSTTTSSPTIRRRNAIKIAPELSTISANLMPTSRAFINILMLKKSPNKVKIHMKFRKREFLVTKAVITFIAIFLLSWIPYIMIVIVAQIGINIENYVTPFTVSLPCLFAKSSTILNPLIYTLINPECKAHFKRLFFGSIKVDNL